MRKPFIIISLLSFSSICNAQTNNIPAMLEKFTSRPVEDILLDLNALKIRERNGEKIEQPLITILLYGKASVTGYLTDLKNEPKEKGIVMKLYNSNDVLFLGMNSIAGVALHDADRSLPLLVSQGPEDVKNFSAVTKLDVKRQLTEQTALLNSTFGSINIFFNEELPVDPVELYFSKFFLSDIAMALITIGKLDLGKEAIQKEVKSIKISRGPNLQVARNSDGLTIQFPFNQSYTTNKERQLLVDKIYDSL